MKPRVTLMTLAVVASVSATGRGQTPPDFAGQWSVEPPAATVKAPATPAAARGDMGSGWGPTILIAQDAKALVVECVVFSRYDLQPQPRFAYALDGSESRNTVMMGRGLQVQSSRARWEGQSLVITTQHTFDDPVSRKPLTIEVTQKVSLESPTALVVEATRGGALGGRPSTTRTVYTKSALPSATSSQAARVQIRFEPETPTPAFERATAEYDALWKAEGSRIVDAMERVTGLAFEERDIRAVVFEGASSSGFRETPMRMRASYPPDIKKGTLIHELGHRFLSGRVPTTKEIDEHRKLFLVLYDIWVALYGQEFADRNVVVESGRKGIYDYDSAWKWTLSMTAQERAARFKSLARR